MPTEKPRYTIIVDDDLHYNASHYITAFHIGM